MFDLVACLALARVLFEVYVYVCVCVCWSWLRLGGSGREFLDEAPPDQKNAPRLTTTTATKKLGAAAWQKSAEFYRRQKGSDPQNHALGR